MDIIIALVVASMITRAIDEAKAKSSEARQRVADRREDARRRREKARAARSKRLETAHDAGPSDPLWWLWAAGWMVAAAASGTAAAAVGARDGARVGAREGYRIGKEKSAQRQARRRRERAAYDKGRADAAAEQEARWVPLKPCPACGTLTADPASCDCRTTTRRTDRRAPEPGPGPVPRRAPGPAPRPDQPRIDHERDSAPGDAPAADVDAAEGPVHSTTHTTERNNEMVRQITSGLSGGDGDGYASTIAALSEVSNLLKQVSEVVNDLGDTLVARKVDSTTTDGINELDDHLQATVNLANEIREHAQSKHEPVATSIAAAGGSSEIAEATWYDDL